MAKDMIPGGLADNKSDKDFDPKALEKGLKVEREHTSSKSVAKEIARDHLTEDPKYYDKLEKIEKKAVSVELARKAYTKALKGAAKLRKDKGPAEAIKRLDDKAHVFGKYVDKKQVHSIDEARKKRDYLKSTEQKMREALRMRDGATSVAPVALKKTAFWKGFEKQANVFKSMGQALSKAKAPAQKILSGAEHSAKIQALRAQKAAVKAPAASSAANKFIASAPQSAAKQVSNAGLSAHGQQQTSRMATQSMFRKALEN